MQQFNPDACQKLMAESSTGRMPVLGFGTWKLKGQQCLKCVKEALLIGYRHIDTAQAYGNESEVGSALSESGVTREEIFLTTKVHRTDLSAESVKKTCDESLERLQSEYIDLLLIHWPNWDIPLAETLGAMGELVEEGKVCHVGVSNFTVGLLEEAVGASPRPLFSNQVEYHPFLSQEPVLDFCRRHNIILTAYSPLARGKVLEEDALHEIGAQYGKSAAQVVLRWLIQQDGVAAIPKASSTEHIKENFKIFDFQLDETDMNRISGFTKRGERLINPSHAFPVPEWDT